MLPYLILTLTMGPEFFAERNRQWASQPLSYTPRPICLGETAVELKDSVPQTRAVYTVQRHYIEEASPGRGRTLFRLGHTHFQNSRGGDYRQL